MATMGHGNQRKNGFPGAITSKSLKNRALRATKTTSWTTNIAVSRTGEKNEDPAKMAHSRMALSKRGLGAKPASSKSDAGARHAGCRYRCRSAHQQQQRFERGSAHLATQPLRLKDSKRKGASARPGLEPEPYGRERRARARAPELLISSARMSKFL